MNVFQAEAWKIIEGEYNSQATVRRTLQQLQGKYENLKTEVRKATAAQRLGLYGTGGGPCKDAKLDGVLLAVLELLNQKTVIGIQSKFDSDADDCNLTSGSSEDLPLVGFLIF